MSQVRRRRALRSSVLVASFAVLASIVVAPPASAEDIPATTSAEPTSGSTPTASSAPDAPGADAPAPETAQTTSDPVPTGDAPTGTGSDDGPGLPSPGDTVVGELVQAWPDPAAEEHGHHDHAHEEHAAEEPLSWIEHPDGDAVRVPTDALPDVTVGSTLSVTVGDEVVDEASIDQGLEPAVEVQAATVIDAVAPDPTTASAGTAPTNTVTAVLVLPAGATADSTSIGTVVNTLNGAVSSFWSEQSNGTVRIAAVQGAAGWVSSAQSCSSAFALWNDVASQIGWTAGAGKHLMLYVPANAPGCSYGLGTVGSSIGSGGRSYVQAAALSVMAHELGHNFGLGHSSELQCDGDLESSGCRTRAYYDFYDVMGISWSQVGTLNVAQAARLGLLPSAEQVALTSSSAATTVTLAPVSAASGTRAVKLTASDGTVYFLEYRQASGQDAWLGDSRNAYRLDSGVVVRRASSGSDTALLLDGSPSRSSGWNSDLQQALPVGTARAVASGQFTVTVTRAEAGSADVQIVTPAGVGPRLMSGSRLGSGQSIESADGFVRVVMQTDGNLVGYGSAGRVLWATYTYAPGASLVMQPDGNAVVYAPDGRVVWHAGTWGNPGSALVVNPDGSTAVRAQDGRELWGTVANTPSRLSTGQILTSYQYLTSADGSVKVVMQPDGNLVSYGLGGRVLWATYTYAPGAHLVIQPDGNLVIYSPDGRAVWNAGTWGHPGTSLVLKPDGSSVVSTPAGTDLWGTNGS